MSVITKPNSRTHPAGATRQNQQAANLKEEVFGFPDAPEVRGVQQEVIFCIVSGRGEDPT